MMMSRWVLMSLVIAGCADAKIIRELTPRQFVITEPDSGVLPSCVGRCTAPEVCGVRVPGECGLPVTCAERGRSCGYVGAELCGTCSASTSCDVGGEARCGRPAECAGLECGIVRSATSAAAYCGSCPGGQLCSSGRCVAGERPLCFGAPIELVPSRPGEAGTIISPYVERGRLVLIQTRDGLEAPDRGCSRFFQGVFGDYDAIRSLAREPLPASDYSDVDPRTSCQRMTDVACDGWVSGTHVRRDGLEMFFSSSYPCGDWADSELYLAWRESTAEPWSRPVLLSTLVTRTPGTIDNARTTVLLGDDRTLLYERDGVLFSARRRTTRPGDIDFEPLGARDTSALVPAEPGVDRQLLLSSLACDGSTLLYVVQGPNDAQAAYEVPVTSLAPLTFGERRRYEAIPPTPWPQRQAFAEAPDCGAVYYWTQPRSWMKRRIACP